MHKGFTLVELLLYTIIAASIMLGASLLFAALLQSQVKYQVVNEVERNGIFVMEQLTQTIRNADSILSPVTSTAAASLSLNMPGITSDPTLFDSAGNAIRITVGTTSTMAITNNRVSVTNLQFNNLTRTGAPGAIRIWFTLSATVSSTLSEYQYAKTFTGSATLRQP